MKELQMDVIYSEDVVVWDSVRLTMQKIQNGKWTDLNWMYQEDQEAIKEQSIQLGRKIDANYEKSDLEQEVNKLIHLGKFQRVIWLSSRKRYEDLFDGNLCDWTGPPVEIYLKDEVNLYHARAFIVPVVHIES